MKIQKFVPTVLCVGLAVVCFHVSVLAQTAESKREPAAITANASGVRWNVPAQYSASTMTVSAPDGQVFSKEFRAGAPPEFTLSDKQGNRLPDGQKRNRAEHPPRYVDKEYQQRSAAAFSGRRVGQHGH